MGLKITGADEGPYPRPTALILTCDNPEHRSSLFVGGGDGIATFYGTFTEKYAAAMAAGWKESPTGFFHCPACSGKVRAETA